jgi:hypothetical protein
VRDIQVRINKQRLDQAGAELCQAQTELIKVDLLGTLIKHLRLSSFYIIRLTQSSRAGAGTELFQNYEKMSEMLP